MTEIQENQINSNKKLNPYDLLNENQKRAVDMRLDFYKYRAIAEKLKLTENYISAWFMTGGACREAYEFKLKEREKENEEFKNKVRKEVENLAPEAIVVIRDALKRGDPDAAFKILAINGIMPIDKLELDFKNREKVSKFSKLIDDILGYVKPANNQSDSNSSSAV